MLPQVLGKFGVARDVRRIYDGTGQNDDIKIKWRNSIRAYGRSMILSFLVSNFLPYSGNLHGGRKDKEY